MERLSRVSIQIEFLPFNLQVLIKNLYINAFILKCWYVRGGLYEIRGFCQILDLDFKFHHLRSEYDLQE